MMNRRNAVRRLMLALMAVVLLIGMTCAYAVETEEYGAKFMKSDDLSVVDVDIINFKVKLRDMGFYSAGISETTLQSKELDDLTMAAVKLVCEYNPDLTYYADGVSNALYWRVMGMVDGGLQTPLDEQYHAMVLGDTDEAIAKLQNRLNQLGYDMVDVQFVPGVYDEALQKAIDEFVRCNKFVYEREDGITVEMQELLFSKEAKAYEPAADPDANAKFSDKVFGYLGSSSNIMNLQIPNAVLLAAGFALLCVIAFMIVRLTVPNGTVIKNEVKSDKLKDGDVEYTIEYKGEQYVYRSGIKQYIRIGRATGDFPLNMQDESVSRKHCEICFENGNLMLKDFSSYGTRINDKLCHHGQQILQSGDVIEIGEHRITIRF